MSGRDTPVEVAPDRRTSANRLAKVFVGQAAQAGGFQALDKLRSLLAQPPPVRRLIRCAAAFLQLVRLAFQSRDLLQPRGNRLAVNLVELLTQRREALGEILALTLVLAGARFFQSFNRGREVFLFGQPRPQRIRTVQITFDSGFKRQLTLSAQESQNVNLLRAPQPEIVKEYSLVARTPTGEERTLAAVKSNFQRLNRHAFEPLEVQSLRLEVQATNGDRLARVFEIRCYA